MPKDKSTTPSPQIPVDRNCLSYWFPKLVTAGVPVPRTEIVDAGDDWPDALGAFDSPEQHPETSAKGKAVIDRIARLVQAAATGFTYPLFLRTSHFSGKHDWAKACHVPGPASVADHVAHLVYMSGMFGMFGELGWRKWVVRELLPVEPHAALPGYDGFPLVTEVRCFVSGGEVRCSHPYWPLGAILEGMRCPHVKVPNSHGDLAAALEHFGRHGVKRCGECQAEAARLFAAADPTAEGEAWMPLSQAVAIAFADDGAWSVDLLKTTRGWFVTDMAEANRSFHYPGCEAQKSPTPNGGVL